LYAEIDVDVKKPADNADNPHGPFPVDFQIQENKHQNCAGRFNPIVV
jgi:hypothetical protein